MNKKQFAAASLVVLVVGAAIGYRIETSMMKIACESTDELIEIGSSQYVCMTKNQVQALVDYVRSQKDNGI